MAFTRSGPPPQPVQVNAMRYLDEGDDLVDRHADIAVAISRELRLGRRRERQRRQQEAERYSGRSARPMRARMREICWAQERSATLHVAQYVACAETIALSSIERSTGIPQLRSLERMGFRLPHITTRRLTTNQTPLQGGREGQ